MSHAKQASKRRRRSSAVPAFRCGQIVAVAGERSIRGNRPARIGCAACNSEMTHEVALSEEEIFDVSLATFLSSTKRAPPYCGAS